MATILIIGGGVSGLSAGIHALLAGHRAIICERHATAGGNLTGWERNGVPVDNCIHWLTGTNPASKGCRLWETLGALGNGIQTDDPELLYSYAGAERRLSLFADLDRFRDQLLEAAPEDEKEVRRLISAVRTLQVLSGLPAPEENGERDPLSFLASLFYLLRCVFLSVDDLSARFSNKDLRAFLSSFIPGELSSLMLLSAASTFCGKNGGIPSGGSRETAKRITKRFLELGGRLLTNSEAVGIETENGEASSVYFADGTRIFADYVIYTGDPAVFFGRILPVGMPKRLRALYENKKLLRFSSVHAAFSSDLAELPFSHDLTVRLSDEAARRLGARHLVLRAFPPTESGKKSVVQAMYFCSDEEARRFILAANDRAAYDKRKEHIAAIIGREIVRTLPGLSNRLTLADVWTPATYRRFTGSEIGSYMSFVFKKGYLPVRISGKIPGFRNVFLATQWQQPPGGLPIAAAVGKDAVRLVEAAESRARLKEKSARGKTKNKRTSAAP